jgi:hypothetical protein
MNKKRGVLFVVLVMFLVLFSFGVIGKIQIPESLTELPGDFYYEEMYVWTDDYNLGNGKCEDKYDKIKKLYSTPTKCSTIAGPGCLLRTYNQPSGQIDSGGCADIKYGLKVTKEYAGKGLFEDYIESGSTAECIYHHYTATGGNYQVLCASNNMWAKCSLGNSIGTVTISEVLEGEGGVDEEKQVLYYCALLDGIPTWLSAEEAVDELEDTDGDKVPDFFDCEPENKNVRGSFGCVETSDDEGNKQWSCTVNPKPEICGDGKDNDCSDSGQGIPCDTNEDCDSFGGEGNFWAKGSTCQNGICQTSDECDSNQGSCELNCLNSSEICGWEEDASLNKCCGDDNGDYGKIFDNNKLICVADKFYNEDGDWETDSWRWEDATDSGDLFRIVTLVDEPSGNIKDYTSDSKKWLECKSEIQPPVSGTIDIKSESERLYCTHLGGDWVYSYCKQGKDDGQIPSGVDPGKVELGGDRGREEGEGLFDLEKMAGSSISNSVGFTTFDYSLRKLDLSGGVIEFIVSFIDEQSGISDKDIASLMVQLSVETETSVFTKDIFDDALNTPLIKRGHNIKIKMKTDPTWKDVKKLTFGTGITGKKVATFENIFFHKDTLKKYCSSNNGYWIEDLDYSESTCEVGKDSDGKGGFYSWLEEKDIPGICCGDDGEYEQLGESLCWNGEVVEANELIKEVRLEIDGIPKSYSCTEDDSGDCKIAGISKVPYTIKNLYPELYDLIFVAEFTDLPGVGPYTIKRKLGEEEVEIRMNGWLELENAKPTVYFDGEELWGCQGQEVYGGLTVPEQGLCGVYGPEDEKEPGLFCSERGWSDKDSVGAEKIISGGELILGEYVTVPPRNRTTETKVMFGKNLVYNSDFGKEFLKKWE